MYPPAMDKAGGKCEVVDVSPVCVVKTVRRGGDAALKQVPTPAWL